MGGRRLSYAFLAGVVCLAAAGCAAQTDPASNVEALTAILNAHGHTDNTPAHYYFLMRRRSRLWGPGSDF